LRMSDAQLAETQLPKRFRDLIDQEVEVFGGWTSIETRRKIPDTTDIPIEDPRKWLKIPDVICVFADMVGSTQLSATTHEGKTAQAYQLFTGTAVRLFDAFDSPYIDVKGDGVFALFNSDQPYRAVAAAVSFKTFASEVFVPKVRKLTKLEVGCHIGIDQKTLLVRKIGLKRYEGRTDRQNEVWAGKAVNMAAKLAGIAGKDKLLVSDRFFKEVTDDCVRISCGCPEGKKVDLWTAEDLSEDARFDFNTGYRLGSIWCDKHGRDFCERCLTLDK
jgi:class 3 adenylate cyclase